MTCDDICENMCQVKTLVCFSKVLDMKALCRKCTRTLIRQNLSQVMTQENYETSDPREFDSSGIPSGESVCFTGTGALFWNMAETEAENAQLSEASASERAVHAGDRVGILVDIAVGSMAILKNGKQVVLRKGLPVGESMRYVARGFPLRSLLRGFSVCAVAITM